MISLNKALTANFILSLTSGLVLLLFSQWVATLFGVPAHQIFPIIGGLLLVFAFTIAIEIKKKRALAILWISIQDALWVLGSLVVVVWRPFPISAVGYYIIDGLALIILLFCIWQLQGLARLDTVLGKKVLHFSRVVKAPKAKVWQLITDVENYHLVAPNIDKVKILSEQQRGKGLVRACSHGKDSWQETCT